MRQIWWSASPGGVDKIYSVLLFRVRTLAKIMSKFNLTCLFTLSWRNTSDSTTSTMHCLPLLSTIQYFLHFRSNLLFVQPLFWNYHKLPNIIFILLVHSSMKNFVFLAGGIHCLQSDWVTYKLFHSGRSIVGENLISKNECSSTSLL